MNKREFLMFSLAGVVASPAIAAMAKMVEPVAHMDAEVLARDEGFWGKIRASYKVRPDFINLENGFYCLLPEETLEHLITHLRDINFQGSHYMRNARIGNKAKVTARLAELAGCGADELIITRNTTESLDTIIAGTDWQAGDEAVMASTDYGSMLHMFEQVERRYGIKRHVIDVPLHPRGDDDIVAAYAAAINPRTRLLMVCHIVNITGQILPIRKICDMAHAQGVDVMVDGAHAFGHFDFSIADLDCDYYGTSLHKWLSVPLGAGFLYVKKENIAKIWPLFASGDKPADDIARLNHTGTYPAATDLAIANAIDYQTAIGMGRKEARLRYLQHYWSDQMRSMDHVILNTPAGRHRSCGIANVGIRGINPKDLATILFDDHGIFTVGIDGALVKGCRIAPNLFTTTQELDVLVNALKGMA